MFSLGHRSGLSSHIMITVKSLRAVHNYYSPSHLGAVCDDFQIAVERARKRIGERLWEAMSFRALIIEIYLELRALDAERVAQQAARKPTISGSNGKSK
jgi:hypothetical protein